MNGKEIVLGICGGIAAYKAAELAREMVKAGGQVHVIMTRSAREFITPLTMQTLSGNVVATDLFQLYEEKEIGHISLARRAQVLVIAPATANIIGKIAHGIADDMLSTVVMATKAPVLIAPAMNEAMWENPVVQHNVGSLKQLGYHFVDPGWGDLACGVQGTGRMADIGDIIAEIELLLAPKDFKGQTVLVTAGPTRELIDPVRFISNPSSGKMGFAIARAFRQRGAQVTLISGPVAIAPPAGVRYLPVQSAAEMRSAVTKHFKGSTIIVKSAAVADYRPSTVSARKIKKGSKTLTLSLERTIDILAELGAKKGNRILVGFAAETHNMREHAVEKLKNKNLDLIVANDVTRKDAGFGSDMNAVQLFFRDGSSETLPPLFKEDIAHILLDRISVLLKKRNKK
jgi:phosphopantothenoylcysteine decarboxylase/phosphopantothenate--cysteine ligase